MLYKNYLSKDKVCTLLNTNMKPCNTVANSVKTLTQNFCFDFKKIIKSTEISSSSSHKNCLYAWEAEIGRIVVQVQPEQIVCENPISKK
jgi:hypothetical protein